jgi:DNA-binding CsgD family transcriptional regulator/pimeloyl-ACP methyl ester carboxylesterase
MSSPVIRFAAMADGGRVAFHVLGSGPPLAMLFPLHVNHLTLNWRVPLHRGAMEYLARYFTVINLDFRGAGLSDSVRGELTTDTLCDGLSAVLSELDVRRAALVAMGAAGPVACHFAARHAQQVSHLVFVASGGSDANQQLLHLRHGTPDVEAQLRGALLGGLGDKRNATRLAAVARGALDAATLAQWERLLRRHEAEPVAVAITVPALYLHAADDQLVPLRAAEAFIERFEIVTLKIVPGRSGMDVWRNRAAVDAVLRFLRAEQPAVRERRSTRLNRVNAEGLSAREIEVVRLIAVGRTNRQIADELFISVNTVSYHLRNIFAKTGAANRTEAAAFAFAAGLTGEPPGSPT